MLYGSHFFFVERNAHNSNMKHIASTPISLLDDIFFLQFIYFTLGTLSIQILLCAFAWMCVCVVFILDSVTLVGCVIRATHMSSFSKLKSNNNLRCAGHISIQFEKHILFFGVSADWKRLSLNPSLPVSPSPISLASPYLWRIHSYLTFENVEKSRRNLFQKFMISFESPLPSHCSERNIGVKCNLSNESPLCHTNQIHKRLWEQWFLFVLSIFSLCHWLAAASTSAQFNAPSTWLHLNGWWFGSSDKQ